MFKKNFERICAERGVSPTKAVTAIGLSDSAYSGWTDVSVPRKTTLIKLAEYLDVTVDDLLTEKPSDGTVAIQATPQEQELLFAFRHLPPASQDALLALVKSYDGAKGGVGDKQQ